MKYNSHKDVQQRDMEHTSPITNWIPARNTIQAENQNEGNDGYTNPHHDKHMHKIQFTQRSVTTWYGTYKSNHKLNPCKKYNSGRKQE